MARRSWPVPTIQRTRASPRAPVEGSRSTRRLRPQGLVPGVVYGGGDEPQHFAVDARTLRNTLAHAGAVLEVTVDGGATRRCSSRTSSAIRCAARRSTSTCCACAWTQPIHATVALELHGAEEAPGVTEGGVLNQETRELNIEALPGDIPDSIVHDVSGLEMNETLTLSVVTAPAGVTLLDDLDETVIATITPPTLEPVEEEIETETALVGEDGEPIEARGRRGRGRGRGARARRPTASDDDAEALLVHPGRLADRRARQPRARLREHPAQRRLPRRRRAGRALGPAEAEEEVRR